MVVMFVEGVGVTVGSGVLVGSGVFVGADVCVADGVAVKGSAGGTAQAARMAMMLRDRTVLNGVRFILKFSCLYELT
jgi:tetrahydrodipicolinate N-succinyltransferase